jgi:aminoglycoside phosphotransferase (APT) family kinase protein
LDADLSAWIEQVSGGKLSAVAQVTAGGRLGYLVDVERDDGPRELFLQRGRGDLAAGGASFMGFEREAEVYRALGTLGLPVPHVWGVDEGRNAMLVDRARGQTWFHPPRDPAEQVSVAQDFIRHLATWHSTPASELDLPSFGEAHGMRDHQAAQVAEFRRTFEAEDAKRPVDALSWYLLELLETLLPDVNEPAVLVQGDTGPGNFMYADGEVTAIIDWELAHLGDPMDDIAWLSWRTVQHSFPDFPARMREYEAHSGKQVDDARVRYYRLNAFARLGPWFGAASMGEDDAFRRLLRYAAEAPESAEIDRALDGSAFLMTTLHRRMRLEAIFDAIGVERPTRDVATEAEPSEVHVLYDVVLRQLRDIAVRAQERVVKTQAKGAARQIKYLKELHRNGLAFDAAELDEIGRLLGRTPETLDEGRAELAVAARERTVAIEDYLNYHWLRLTHDDHLMREASGALYERTWPLLR